jgi:copper(I)-binding protein
LKGPAGRTATLCDVRLIRLRDGGDDSVIRRTAIRLAASAAAVALVPALAGCAAGVNAQTNQPFTPTDGASTVFHNIAIRDVFVLGPRVNGALQPGQDAGMFLALVNNGTPDQLTAVSAPGTATSVTIHGGTVQLGQAQPALLTGPSPELVLNGLTRPLIGGQSVPMTLTFQNAGTIAMIIPVVPRANFYATFSPPAPSPTPTPTPTKKGNASKSPRPSPSGSARPATATPTPSSTP